MGKLWSNFDNCSAVYDTLLSSLSAPLSYGSLVVTTVERTGTTQLRILRASMGPEKGVALARGRGVCVCVCETMCPHTIPPLALELQPSSTIHSSHSVSSC